MTYEKHMRDTTGDLFAVRAEDGIVIVIDPGYENKDHEDCVANLAFTPDEALDLARALTKAAVVAYEQERDASE